MKKHGKFFVPNIVLGIILGIMVLGDVLFMGVFSLGFKEIRKEAEIYDNYGSGSESKSDLTWDLEDSDDTEEASGISEGWEAGENPDDYYQWYELITVEAASLTLLGDTWQGIQAEEDTQLYLAEVTVRNQGTQNTAARYVSLYFEGEKYDDVEEIQEESNWDTMSDLEYYNRNIIPAGQSGTITQVLQIKNGVSSVELSYYDLNSELAVFQVAVP